MFKRISISVRGYIFDTYLAEITENRSEFIEKCIVYGIENFANKKTTQESEIAKLIQINRNLELENNKLKLQIGSLREKLERKPKEKRINGLNKEQRERTAMNRALINAGVLRDGWD